MDTEKISLYIITGAIITELLILAIIKIVKFCRLSKAEKKKMLIAYLKEIIALIEQEITGTEEGKEYLKTVESYFNKHAPITYKIILWLLGKDNLQSLIEEAFEELKKSFGG